MRVDVTFSMVHTCEDCGQKFLSRSEYDRHRSTHLQTHLDKWGATNTLTWKSPHGMNPALYKAFQKYNLGDKAMLCLWVNGQLNTAIRERSRILELQDRLKEWLQETKISKTRRVEFKCTIIATCNSIQKLRKPLLSRFAVINIPEYDKDQFINVAKDRLGNNPLAQYITEEVWNSSKNPNIRDCVRIAAISKTEQDVLRYLRVLGADLGESK